jgi:hypothetical protein
MRSAKTTMDSQVDRIRKAEEAMKQLVEYSANARRELEDIEDIKDPDLRKEVVEAIEGMEREAQDLNEALRKWKLDIH